MAKIYANKIMLGTMTLDMVPTRLYQQVVDILDERGYDYEH